MLERIARFNLFYQLIGVYLLDGHITEASLIYSVGFLVLDAQVVRATAFYVGVSSNFKKKKANRNIC